MGYGVFISYASKDKTAADAACARLEAAGIRCWIAPRDIVPGTSYGEAIIEAIHGLKVMVLVFSSNANASAHIPKEVERAMSSGVAIIPFRIEDVPGKVARLFYWLGALARCHDAAARKTSRRAGGYGSKAIARRTRSARAADFGLWQRSSPPAPPAARSRLRLLLRKKLRRPPHHPQRQF